MKEQDYDIVVRHFAAKVKWGLISEFMRWSRSLKRVSLFLSKSNNKTNDKNRLTDTFC